MLDLYVVINELYFQRYFCHVQQDDHSYKLVAFYQIILNFFLRNDL